MFVKQLAWSSVVKTDDEFRWRPVNNVWSPKKNAYPVLFFDFEPSVKRIKVRGSLLMNSRNRALQVVGDVFYL